MCCFIGIISAFLVKYTPYVQALLQKQAGQQYIQNPSLPARIFIPSIHADAAIESVGLDSQGLMDVPKNASDAA